MSIESLLENFFGKKGPLYTKSLSALADKMSIVCDKIRGKMLSFQFLALLRYPHSKGQSPQILSTLEDWSSVAHKYHPCSWRLLLDLNSMHWDSTFRFFAAGLKKNRSHSTGHSLQVIVLPFGK